MGARTEITRKFARQYARCSKKDKGRVLDEVVLVTGRSRDNARRRLAAAAKPGPRLVKPARKQRERKYSYDATKSAPEGLGRLARAVWEVPGRVDAATTRRSGTTPGTHPWQGTILTTSARGTAGDEPSDHRPLPRPGPGEGRATRYRGNETLAIAAVVDHYPQGRGRGRERSRVLRGRH